MVSITNSLVVFVPLQVLINEYTKNFITCRSISLYESFKLFLTMCKRFCRVVLRIKSLFFYLHDVMKTVGGVKIP